VVKSKGRIYLPPLDSHKQLSVISNIGKTPSKYDEYVMRALFYNAMGRTVEGLAGFVFQKPPTCEVPEEFKEHFKDVTNTGIDLATFALETTQEILTTGRCGILVDMIDSEDAPAPKPEKPKDEGVGQPDEMKDGKAKSEDFGAKKPAPTAPAKEEENEEEEKPAFGKKSEEKPEESEEKPEDDDEEKPDYEMSDGGTATEEPYRPYWVSYRAEDIISWKTERRGTDPNVLVRVVLREFVEEQDQKDEFVTRQIEQYRELSLESDAYAQKIWRRKKDVEAGPGGAPDWMPSGPSMIGPTSAPISVGVSSIANVSPAPFVGGGDEWQVFKTENPVKHGKPLPAIPFVFLSPTSTAVKVAKPPLLDLADVNISHYRTMADLEHGRHFTALPTPWVSGARATDPNEPLAIGSGVAWDLEKGGTAGMLEFTGAGLGALVTAEIEKRKMMAVLGARLLETEAAVAETATAILLRHSSEGATLRTLTETLAEGLTRVAQWHIWWVSAGTTPDDVEASITLNKEFFAIKMTSQEVQAQLQLLQAEAISYETFYYNITTGGWTRPGVTAEEEKEQIMIEGGGGDAPLIGPDGLPIEPALGPDGMPLLGPDGKPLPPGVGPPLPPDAEGAVVGPDGKPFPPGTEDENGVAGDKVVIDQAPFKVVQRAGKFVVLQGGKVVGTHPNIEMAKAQFTALAKNAPAPPLVKDVKKNAFGK
jgi:hypothetical protein